MIRMDLKSNSSILPWVYMLYSLSCCLIIFLCLQGYSYRLNAEYFWNSFLLEMASYNKRNCVVFIKSIASLRQGSHFFKALLIFSHWELARPAWLFFLLFLHHQKDCHGREKFSQETFFLVFSSRWDPNWECNKKLAKFSFIIIFVFRR